jgi:GH15 family glucan-1,4-alpha-glucosidase
MDNGIVCRYRVDDGLQGHEGAFGLCTFWLADALCLSGRSDEAQRIFEGMIDRASPLGLFSEEIDPVSGAFLGNYPQAFTHIGLINSALYLSVARGEGVPEHPPIGSQEHRERSAERDRGNTAHEE